ncbi:MAG: hypothetical protein ACYS1A_11455 [Planctomycetota bacterium]|jgi:hypothetical protein
MKSETQIRIGITTALVVIFFLLTAYALHLYQIATEKQISPEQAEQVCRVMIGIIIFVWPLMVLLVVLLAAFAWSLTRRKQEGAATLLFIYTMLSIALVFINIVVWLMHWFVVLLLYQGVLGVRKLQISIAPVDKTQEPEDGQKQ